MERKGARWGTAESDGVRVGWVVELNGADKQPDDVVCDVPIPGNHIAENGFGSCPTRNRSSPVGWRAPASGTSQCPSASLSSNIRRDQEQTTSQKEAGQLKRPTMSWFDHNSQFKDSIFRTEKDV